MTDDELKLRLRIETLLGELQYAEAIIVELNNTIAVLRNAVRIVDGCCGKNFCRECDEERRKAREL